VSVSQFFGNDYVSARSLFLNACQQRGIKATSRRHPTAVGPGGEDLFMDVVRLGSNNAKGIFFVTSATHGTEGLTGSGVQVALLNGALTQKLPDDVALVLVHAINPYGFAHLRRTNEDNIDLNRNFVDFSNPLPENCAYDDIHSLIVPPAWSGPKRDQAEKALTDYSEQHGEKKLQAVLLKGQYTQPSGLFYGGTEPSWSNRCWSEIVAAQGQGARHLAIIDVHTGVGPTGYGEPIFVGRDRDIFRARDWYGEDVTNAGKGKSHASEFKGPMVTALWSQYPELDHTAIVLEFGTRPLSQVLQALRADNWLHLHPETHHAQYQKIKRDLRDALYVDEDAWRRDIWTRSKHLIGRGIIALGRTVSS